MSSPSGSASSGSTSSTAPARATPRSSMCSTSTGPRVSARRRGVRRYDPDTGEPLRDAQGRVRKVKTGEPGLLISEVSNLQPFDGYTDKEASEKKLVATFSSDGDVWFNTGDLMRPGLPPRRVHRPARRHLPLEGRERRHHRGRGRGANRPAIEECHGLRRRGPRRRRPRRHGGHPAQGGLGVRRQVTCRGGLRAPSGYAVPLFVRIVESSSPTPRRSRVRRSICAKRPTALPTMSREGPMYALAGRDEGYVEFYAEYPEEVEDGKRPEMRSRAIGGGWWLKRVQSSGRWSAGATWKVQSSLCGRPVAGDRALIMAIVNRTPDSFYDRGATFTDEAAKAAVHRVVDEGADLVDIGGVKAGPGARRRGRGDQTGGAVRRMAARRLPRPADQCRHLARVGRQVGLRGRRGPDQRHLGGRRPGLAGWRPSSARAWCARTPAARCRARGRFVSLRHSEVWSTMSSPR